MATKQVRKPGRPAKKTRRTFAAGGVVRLEQGEKVPAPVQRTLADAAASARRGMSLTSDGNPTGNPDAGAPVTGQGYDRAADYGYNAVEAAVRGGRAAGNYGQRMMQPMDNPDAGAPVTGQRSPLPGAVVNYVQRIMQPMDNPDAGAPVTGQRSPPARVAGTIGRIGRGPVTDEDLFSQTAPVASPGLAPPPGPTLASALVPSAVASADSGYDYSSKAGSRGAAPAAGVVPAAPPQQRSAPAAVPSFDQDNRPDPNAQLPPSRMRNSLGLSPEAFNPGGGSQGGGQGMVGGSLAGQRAMADNALLQKWYSMPENQRGRMPASVENAKYRGADDTETAFNVARARIMEARLHPAQQAQALANLDKTRTDMLNQSQQTRQTGEYQQGQLGNERERTGVFRQQVEQTGQNQQAQMAHQQRMAQLALDQGVAEGALLPDEEYQKERALDDAYNTAYEQRRTIRERARRILMGRMMKGETLQDVLANPGTDDERAMLSTIINPSVAMRRTQYAGGGMVSPQPPVYGGAPDAQRADPLINAYRIYTTQSKAMGAPTVPFAEFSSLYAGAAQGPMQPPVGMAGGGAVPAAGKMVVDTNPNARVDSIPAMIDGEQPAALNSGEFVFPTDVTSYYGTKMLSGMIEKARQGANGSKPSGRSAEAV